MGIINTLFTGIGALFIGILLGFIIAGIIGDNIWYYKTQRKITKRMNLF